MDRIGANEVGDDVLAACWYGEFHSIIRAIGDDSLEPLGSERPSRVTRFGDNLQLVYTGENSRRTYIYVRDARPRVLLIRNGWVSCFWKDGRLASLRQDIRLSADPFLVLARLIPAGNPALN